MTMGKKANSIRMLKHMHGFTLIELLVVIAIIALLMAVIAPSLKKAKEMSRNLLCMSNMRQTVTAIHVYAQEYNNSLVSGDQIMGHDIWNVHTEGPHAGNSSRPCNLGHLLELDMLPMSTSASSHPFYCPTMNIGKAIWGFTYENSGPYAATNPRGFEGWGLQGRLVNIGYEYRDTIDGQPGLGMTVAARKIESRTTNKITNGRMALVTDIISWGTGMYAHKAKYNYCRSDGSTQTLIDPGKPMFIHQRFDPFGKYAAVLTHYDDALFFGFMDYPERLSELVDPAVGWSALP